MRLPSLFFSRAIVGTRRSVLLNYFTKALIGRILLCAFVLVSLMEILALLEQTTPILARNLGIHGLLIYAALHLPAIFLRAIPLSVLIGALVLLTQLSLGSEVASLRAAGLSTGALFLLMLPSALGFSGVGIVLDQVVAPRSELALARWWNATDPQPQQDTPGFWFHDGNAILHVAGFGNAGHRLYGLDIYQRAANGALVATGSAPTVDYQAGGWTTSDYQTLTLSRDSVAINDVGQKVFQNTGVTPDDVILLSQPYPSLSNARIDAILHHGAPASLPKATYRMALFAPYIMPFNLCVMLLLALPVVYTPPRTGNRSMLPVAALGAGFAFVVLQGLLQALGNAGTLPAALAILAAPLMATLLGVTWLLKMEET